MILAKSVGLCSTTHSARAIFTVVKNNMEEITKINIEREVMATFLMRIGSYLKRSNSPIRT